MGKVKVFAYKGFVGISADENSEGIIAHPGNGNLGVVCDSKGVEISEEALELLNRVDRGHDSLGEVDVFKANDGVIVFSWLGGYKKAFRPEEIEGSRDTNMGLLTSTPGVEVEKEFMEFIDNYTAIQ